MNAFALLLSLVGGVWFAIIRPWRRAKQIVARVVASTKSNISGYKFGRVKVVEVHRHGHIYIYRFDSPSELVAAVIRPSLGFTVEEICECERLAVELCSVEV